MERYMHYVGIDISNDDHTCSILSRPDLPILATDCFVNQLEGFETFEKWLKTHGVDKQHAIICMEATGVYGEALCYWLVSKGYQVAVEPPLKVKRAFYPKGHKNDRVDSKQIAEYAYRFQDKLYIWEPRNQLVEQIKKEMIRLISLDQQFKILVHWIDTAPGVGLLLAANVLVITNGFTKHLDYPTLAAMIGICPYQHRSGSSVRKRDKSAGFGPARLRKLLHLAARSVKTHKAPFIKYFARKEAEGKPKKLILNNIANKLLRILCAIIREQKPYIPNYVSVNPMLLKNS